MSTPNNDHKIREILDNVNITDAWRAFILYAREVVPHGEISIKIANGEPTDYVSSKRKLRFDKPGDIVAFLTKGLDKFTES